jgi:hypothetical protein
MSAPGVEAFLARLYSDAALRESFLQDDKTGAKTAMADLSLTEIEQAALLEIDRVGLQMAAASYANKRAHHIQKRGLLCFLSRLFSKKSIYPSQAERQN